MTFRRTHRVLTSLLAAVALLMAMVAPGGGWGPGAGQGGDLQEVCSTDGMRWVAAGDSDAPAPSSGHHHCRDCTLHAPLAFVPTLHAHGLTLSALRHALPRAWLAAPRTLHAWATAQPRAPPRFS